MAQNQGSLSIEGFIGAVGGSQTLIIFITAAPEYVFQAFVLEYLYYPICSAGIKQLRRELYMGGNDGFIYYAAINRQYSCIFHWRSGGICRLLWSGYGGSH